MQLGFVIDQSRCIGCHACTVACKSENQVPVGSFRTWVKYTEDGTFPTVKRSFAVLRCNQCTAAPCVTICPVSALEKRADGIVDIDPDACIGCKSCLQGCPYDALYINPEKGTAQKCHFCAHRTEQGLAPACAVVCPTEAIIPGDFDDPASQVAKLKRDGSLKARKTEAGTGPNVFYRDVAPAGIDPNQVNPGNGHIWADKHPGLDAEALEFAAQESEARARTTYDVAHPPPWGTKITGYLFTKSIAAGVFLAGAVGQLAPMRGEERASLIGIPILGLLFLTATSLLLVLDLKRPERFLYIILRPNWSSWLVKGTYALMAYGGLLTLWLVLGFTGSGGHWLLRILTVAAAFLAASYTGWLFEQSKARVLWMRQGFWFHLLIQAFMAGSAVLLLASPFLNITTGQMSSLATTLILSLGLHLFYVLLEDKWAPAGREEEYKRTLALIESGPFASRHRWGGVVLGVMAPILLLILAPAVEVDALVPLAAILALLGLWIEEDIFVRAGQALPIS